MKVQEEYAFVPKVILRIYKISNEEGYFYIGITRLDEDKCVKQHYARSVLKPHLKIYKHLAKDLKKEDVKFEVIEEIMSDIGGSTPSSYEWRKKLEDYITPHLSNPLCLNIRHHVGLTSDQKTKCYCGGIYPKNKYAQHQQTIIHLESKLSESESELD